MKQKIIDKYIDRMMIDYPEADKIQIDLEQFYQEMAETKAGQDEPMVIGLNGEAIKMGKMYVDDEELMGVFVLCNKEEFRKQTCNLLYKNVKIIPKIQ